ncbi:putative CENPB DNA-binding domain-containing protein 1 isoform X2 [Megachile rotundata]
MMPNEDKKTPVRRNFISLEMKIHILDRLKNGEKATYIAKSLQLNEATIRTIKQNEEKIRTAVAVGSSVSARMSARPRAAIIEKMEKALSLWIADYNEQQIPLDSAIIKEKALLIYDDLKENGETPVNPEFVASKGWFERFKKRFSLQNMKIQANKAISVPEIVENNSNFTLEALEEGLNLAEQLESFFWKTDPSTERSATFQRELRKCLAPYRKIYKDLLNEDRRKIDRCEKLEDDGASSEDKLPSKRVCLVELSSDEETS